MATRIAARVASAVLKLLGGVLWLLALHFTLVIANNRTQQDLYRGFPEFYNLMVMLSFLAPAATGLIALGVSALIDIWLGINSLSRKLDRVKRLSPPGALAESPPVRPPVRPPGT